MTIKAITKSVEGCFGLHDSITPESWNYINEERLPICSSANASGYGSDTGTRPVSRQDAGLAVGALAFLLQDAGWAVNE